MLLPGGPGWVCRYAACPKLVAAGQATHSVMLARCMHGQLHASQLLPDGYLSSCRAHTGQVQN